MNCIDCGIPVEHDVEAESWLRRPVLFDPDVVDIDNPGTHCPETEDEHRVDES